MSLVLVAAAACGGGKSSADKTATAGAGTGAKTATTTGGLPADMAPDDQQVLVVNDGTTGGAEPNTIDPQATSYTYEVSIDTNIFDTLFTQDPKTSVLVPMAAAEVPTTANGGISSDGLTITIKLAPGRKWSDGTPVTAQDWVYGIIRGFNLNVSGSGYGGFITGIKGAAEAGKLDAKSPTYVADVAAAFKDSVVAVDASTIKIVITAPSASFLSNLTLPITSAVKQANVEAVGADFGLAAGASKMVTNGPFTVKEWVPKDHLTLARNVNFTRGHKAYLKEITYKFIEDQNQAYNAYQSGQLDEAAIPPVLFAQVSGDASLKALLRQEEVFGVDWISVDRTIDPWKNKDFVLAVAQATDRDTIAKDVYFNTRKAWNAPCAAAVLACSPETFKTYAFDLTAAKASIAKAYPNGSIPHVTLEIPNDPVTKALATTLQSQWDKIGVTADIVTTDQKTLRADMKGHKSGTQITGWTMDFADATDLWSIFTTAQIGGNNLGFYSNPDYDKLSDKQDATLDTAARKTLLGQLQTILAGDPPNIPFTVRERVQIFKPYVKGLSSSPFNWSVYSDQTFSEVYIAKH
jgi:oligopeptide transport system substrate-binding protein